MRSVTMKCPNCGFEGDASKRVMIGAIAAVIGIVSLAAFVYGLTLGDFSGNFSFYIWTPFVVGAGIGIAAQMRKCPQCGFSNTVQK